MYLSYTFTTNEQVKISACYKMLRGGELCAAALLNKKQNNCSKKRKIWFGAYKL